MVSDKLGAIHYATPQVLDLCDDLGLSHVFGLPKNSRLAEHVEALEASTAARYARKPGQKLRRFKTFSYAARSWPKPRRVIARVEVSPNGRDTRYIVTLPSSCAQQGLLRLLFDALTENSLTQAPRSPKNSNPHDPSP